MSKCGNNIDQALIDSGNISEKPHKITAGDDMDVVRVEGGNYIEDIIHYNPYTAPNLSVAFTPTILEEGLTPLKSDQKVRFQVTKGKNEVVSIKSQNFGIDITDPNLPYDSGQLDHYGSGNIGETEELSATLNVNDGVAYSKTTTQKRGHRVYYGVADSASIDGNGAVAAASNQEVITGIPGNQQFDCGTGKYWFVLIQSVYTLSFTINGFKLEPIIKQYSIDPVTGYSVMYNLYLSPVEMTGIVDVNISNG